MGRFFAPIIAYAAAAYVYWKNLGATAEFVFLFPMQSIYDDPVMAGQRSWQALLVIATLWLITDAISLIRERRAKAAPEAKA